MTTEHCRPVPAPNTEHHRPPRDCRYHQGYIYGGVFYPDQFFAYNHWCPTRWTYFPYPGYWYSPEVGVSSDPPESHDPITIEIDETVPETSWDDSLGDWVPVTNLDDSTGESVPVTKQVKYKYNAEYYPDEGKYGYYDYLGDFHFISQEEAQQSQ